MNTKILQLPVPKLVVFYNGTKEQKDETILRLSDSFPEGADPDIEVKVRMININYGHSKEILEACKPLMEYSWLVEEIRQKVKSLGLEGSVKNVIETMPQDYVIRQFLIEHKSEVMDMLLTEYDEVETMELFKEEGRQEGRQEGIIETLAALAAENIITLNEAAVRAGMSKEDFENRMALLKSGKLN